MRLLRWLLWALLIGVSALLVAGWLGSMSPLLDLANLVALPVALACLALAVILFFMMRGWLWKGALALLALASGLTALPPADAPAQCAADAARIRVAWLNAQGGQNPAAIITWLEREQPDIVGFAELSDKSRTARQLVEGLYPHYQSCLGHQRCSTIIYTREQPLDSDALGYGNPHNRTGLSAARISHGLTDGKRLNLMAVHLSRPLPLGAQGKELAGLEVQIEKPADTVIIGDFNANRRMHVLGDFARRNGLVAAAANAPTWPLHYDGEDANPLIQIDHFLIGRNWAVEGLRVSEHLGSDHRGLVGDLCRRM